MIEKYRNKTYFYVFLLLVIGLGLIVLWPLRDMLLLALVITTLFRPIYELLLRKLKFPKVLATATTVLTVLFTVLVPVSIFINLSIAQFQVFYRDINQFLKGGSSVYDVVVEIFNKINILLAQIPYVEYKLSIDSIRVLIQQNVTPLANAILSYSVDIGVSFAQSFPLIIVMAYLLWYGFPEYERMVHFVKRLSPLSENLDNLYIDRMTAMVKGIAKGTFTVALIQGAIAAISFWIAGVPYVFFWFLTLVVFSILPLGSSFITIPAAVIMFLMGNYWQAIFLLMVQFLFTSTIDNILRPYLVPKEAELHPVLLLLSFIGGIQVFGIWGFVYGPVIMVMMMTTLEVYQKYYKAKE
ncbi:AI-2E family transporter [bacterium]|nr:AI-2E family transporter [bacterium]